MRATLSWRPVALGSLPVGVIALSLLVWITGVSRSGFWADDFLNVTQFDRSLGNLGNDRINAGRYVTNLFWAIGTYAFGSGSDVPFLLLNGLVFAIGLVLWLRVGARKRWDAVGAVWIGGLWVATAAWYTTALSASAIGHSCGFVALGVGLLCHERCMTARTPRDAVLWSAASGLSWTFAVMSNIIYIGLIVIAGYCAFNQVLQLRRLGIRPIGGAVASSAWNLGLPLLYFATVAYPATRMNAAYATTGLRFLDANVDFYTTSFAPTATLGLAYLAVLAVGVVGGIAGVRRRDWLPITLLLAAGAMAVPALIQSQQRSIEYLEMPLLLFFSAAVAGARPVMLGASRGRVRLRRALFVGAAVVLLLVFRQGADVRAYFVESPFGSSLAAFRSQVASLTPVGGTICANLDLSPQDQALLIADMSGEDGFLVPPVSAAQAYLVVPGASCPIPAASADITVGIDARGDFFAVGTPAAPKAGSLPSTQPSYKGSIRASPNPAAAGNTTITWHSTSRFAVVVVSMDGQSEKLFAAARSGRAVAPWILGGHSYRFRLYASPQSHTALASVTVKR